MVNINPISAFNDNYIWAVHSKARSEIVVVDPGDHKPVLAYLKKNHLTLCGILLTHHHWDHSGGIVSLLNYFQGIPVYASTRSRVPGVSHFVKENDEISFDQFPFKVKVLEIPGHTLDHVAFYGEGVVFCGDTLFSCGCGRIFEGTPQQMVNSLTKLKSLPASTRMYCGHEYTLANCRFAKMVDPNNPQLDKRQQFVEQLRQQAFPSLPVTMGEELATNPFLRCNQPEIIQSVQKHSPIQAKDQVTIFTHLRQWKDHFA